MAMIYVKAKPDRAAFIAGKIIPQDKFVPVTDDPYVRRLADHWGDIEIEGGGKESKPAQAKGKTQQTTVGGDKEPGGNQAPGTGAPSPRN